MKGFIEFKESKGGAKAGKLELIKINLDKAKAFAEDIFKKNNRDLEEELPDFDDNFIKAQRIAGGGFAQRKDMPVISNNDVKNLQRTLKKGEIDITKPFSSPVVANDPFPQGLDKGTGKSWLKSGIKRNDGDAKDDVVNVKIKKVSVGNLKPIQSQIYFDKSINIDGRKKAISKAISIMKKNDILLIAGKGHEKTQEIKGKVSIFDDEIVAKEYFDKRVSL